MLPINILITNFCNQNCPFCFARLEMKNRKIKQEMNISNFEKILKQIKFYSTINIIKLLGGEPTLHSKFQDIIKLALKYFPNIQVFSNGILNKSHVKFLEQYFPRIKFTFNVSTPGFQTNKKIKDMVLEYINNFSAKTQVTLSLTLNPSSNIELIINNLPQTTIKSVHSFCINPLNPIFGQKIYYGFQNFPKIGESAYKLVRHIKKINPSILISFGCGFTMCMFTKKQLYYLKQHKIHINGWGCFGKLSSMDINPNLQAFHCFPLAKQKKLNIRNNNLVKLNSFFLELRYQYWKALPLLACLKCPFYGHTPKKCPGPCIGFMSKI